MELPHLGTHCAEKTCNKLGEPNQSPLFTFRGDPDPGIMCSSCPDLVPVHSTDFLPVRCDSCAATFCIDHYPYVRHNCKSGLQKDVQVPVCPLCSVPVPTPKGLSPDVSVSRHIDQDCKSETRKIYTNQCTMRGCRKKELIPVVCSQCKRNFCLAHRHTADHKCDPSNAVRDQRANAAQRRIESQSSRPRAAPSGNHAQAVQGSMSEDEALARALALSMQQHEEATHGNSSVTVGGGDSLRDKCSLS